VAYVFRRHHGRWRWQQTIAGIDASAGDDFGVSVDISGDTIAVGAPGTVSLRPGEDCYLKVGVVFVFHRFRAGWFEMQRIVPEQCIFNDGVEGAYQFGAEVRLRGSTLATRTEVDYPNVGQTIFVYQQGTSGSFAPAGIFGIGFEEAGAALALSHSTLVVGVPYARGGYEPGYANIFALPRLRGNGHDTHDEADDCD
jgi:hypothetical protein